MLLLFFVVKCILWFMLGLSVIVGALATVLAVNYFNGIENKYLSVAGVGFSIIGYGLGMTVVIAYVVPLIDKWNY